LTVKQQNIAVWMLSPANQTIQLVKMIIQQTEIFALQLSTEFKELDFVIMLSVRK
jgi:hypothetical protein